MQKYAEDKGYKTYFCKDNNLHEYVFELLYFLPEIKFIYLYRDPRDVAVSQLKRPLQTDSIINISELWRNEQISCISVLQYINSNSIYKISYEKLIENSEVLVKEICIFLNTLYNKNINANATISTGKSHEWENLSKDVMINNKNKYKNKLTIKQISIIESICWNQMKYLSYTPESNDQYTISRFERVSDKIVGRLKLFYRQKFNIHETDKWSIKRAKLLNKIKNRINIS